MTIDRIDAPDYTDLRPFDHDRAEAAVRELLLAIGEDPDREGLRDTPARVARAYEELLAGIRRTPEEVLTTTFEAGHDEMVLVKDIELWSMCEHHLVPFTGVAHIGYIPNEDGRITGLSKLARLVDVYARRPAGAGAADHPGRRLADGDPPGPRRHRRDRGRAPLHDDARRPQAGLEDDHLRDPRLDAQRRHPLRGDEPDHARHPLSAADDALHGVSGSATAEDPCGGFGTRVARGDLVTRVAG